MKIGFAITAYDKFEETEILINIIRNEFINEYPISFCSNHPDGSKFAQRMKIDSFIQGRNILHKNYKVEIDKRIERNIIVLRSTDTVQRSCSNSLSLNVDYIIHMHSDAWVLNEEKIIEMADKMKEYNKKIALRGAGLEYFDNDTPVGHMDDHFFMFERNYFIQNKVWDFKPEYFFPERFTVHGILFLNILTKVGLEKIWYYRNTKKLLSYDKKIIGYRTVRPVSYDCYYDFIHIHRGDFPGDYGKAIQALFLYENNLMNCDYLNNFVKRYYIPRIEIECHLEKLEKKLNLILRLAGYGEEIIKNREIVGKQIDYNL